MAFGDALQKRMEELAKRQPMIEKRLAEIAEGATLRAIEVATELTPPNTFEDGEQRGVNMITGEMSESWSTASKTVPTGSDFTTTLENDKEYASYVNDGHKVKKRYVPGLYIDDNGLLSYEPKEDERKKLEEQGTQVGMMVGTKTTKVEGLDIVKKALEKYDEVAKVELDKFAKEMFQ